MSGIALATSVIGAGASYYSGQQQKKAQNSLAGKQMAMTAYAGKKAKKHAKNAMKEINATAAQNASTYHQYLDPYIQQGQKYNPLYEYLSSGVMNPQAQAMMGGNDINTWIASSPAYKYQQEQSEKTLNQAAAARGMYNSSAAINALGENSRALSARNWEDYYNRLGGLINRGYEASGNMADALADNNTWRGNGVANAWQGIGSQGRDAMARVYGSYSTISPGAMALNTLASGFGQAMAGMGQQSQQPQTPQGGNAGYGNANTTAMSFNSQSMGVSPSRSNYVTPNATPRTNYVTPNSPGASTSSWFKW